MDGIEGNNMSHPIATLEYGENENDLLPDIDADGEPLEEVCDLCEGSGIVSLGQFDDIVEMACPHVVAEHKERDLQSRLSQQKEDY